MQTLRALAGALFLVCAFATHARADSDDVPMGPPQPSALPLAQQFVSPVGDPSDFALPAPGEDHGYTLTRGVQRKHDRHLGLDLSNREKGGEVRSPADGVVIESRRYAGWGQLIVIAHRLATGDCVMSLLAHLQPGSVKVQPGDRVTAGEPLAAVGQSGHATGPHLHFEMRDLGHADPWRTLWEKAPVLDPLHVLGSHLQEALYGLGKRAPDAVASAEFLTLLGGATTPADGSHVGDPGAPLTRLEFYTWLDAASQAKASSAAPTWKRLRQRFAHEGVVLPLGKTADETPVSVEEAQDALSRLLAADRIARVEESSRVTPGQLRRRSLPVPAPSLSATTSWTVGPSPALTRGDGALLLLAARSWPFAAGAAHYLPARPAGFLPRCIPQRPRLACCKAPAPFPPPISPQLVR
jgi:hypothetical protein